MHSKSVNPPLRYQVELSGYLKSVLETLASLLYKPLIAALKGQYYDRQTRHEVALKGLCHHVQKRVIHLILIVSDPIRMLQTLLKCLYERVVRVCARLKPSSYVVSQAIKVTHHKLREGVLDDGEIRLS